jgi:hypothetical protein
MLTSCFILRHNTGASRQRDCATGELWQVRVRVSPTEQTVLSPARTAAQRLEALRGGRQITLSSTIHIIARSSSWLPGRIASGTAATVYRPHSQHASKSRDGQAIPQDSIVSLMTPCSQIPEDTESIPEAEGDSAVMPDLGSERLRHLKRLANDHGHGASRPSSLRLGLCVRIV